MARDNRPNLDLSVKVQTTTGGEFELKPTAARARDRVRGLNWRTKLGEGFSDGGGTLARRVDQDHPDVGLNDIWTVVDANGDSLYEGRLVANPRSLDQTHSLSVTLVGLMADAKRRKFAQIFVDRSLSHWTGPSLARKAALNANFAVTEPVVTDGGTSNGIRTGFTGPWGTTPARPISEAWYDAHDIPIGVLFYSWQRNANVSNADTNWTWAAALSTDDLATAADSTGNLRAAGPGSGSLTATASNRIYASLQLQYANVASASNAEFAVDWPNMAVYGTAGLATYPPVTAGQPNGVLATDVFRYIIDTYCPTLSSDGVQSSDYVIAHLEFIDRTYPYDALLQLNKYLLWKLVVWENGRVVFEPHDLSDYTWQIRTDDPNVSLDFQGPSTESIYNGVAVTYQDLITGRTATITPDDRTDLADSDPENPFNKAGIQQWLEVTLSRPQTVDDAAAIGVAELAEANRPKAPGTFTVTGCIRDRSGNWQHVGKVRAGDTIAITNHPNDDPRLIVETDYQDDNKQVRIATDLPFQLVEAIMDRVDVDLQAVGLRS